MSLSRAWCSLNSEGWNTVFASYAWSSESIRDPGLANKERLCLIDVSHAISSTHHQWLQQGWMDTRMRSDERNKSGYRCPEAVGPLMAAIRKDWNAATAKGFGRFYVANCEDGIPYQSDFGHSRSLHRHHHQQRTQCLKILPISSHVGRLNLYSGRKRTARLVED